MEEPFNDMRKVLAQITETLTGLDTQGNVDANAPASPDN